MGDSLPAAGEKERNRGEGAGMGHRIRRFLWLLFKLFANLIIASAVLLLVVSFKNPMLPRTYAYSLIRDVARNSLELKTWNWYSLEGEHFRVKYQPVDGKVARLVLDTAEEVYYPVIKLMGYTPREVVPVLIYPTRVSLNRSFGWDGDVNAMGVYWAGAIRILSPEVWIEEDKNREQTFKERGPLAHEFAHLLVDYRAGGNYPRWLTEGIALFVEREITGYEFEGPGIAGSVLYPLEEMDGGFDLLADQNLAYRQSLLVVDYIAQGHGFAGVLEILDQLGRGKDIGGALEAVTGQNWKDFEKGFRAQNKQGPMPTSARKGSRSQNK